MFIDKIQDSIKQRREAYLASKPRPKKIESYDQDKVLRSYLNKLDDLRKDGTNTILNIKAEKEAIKHNKQLTKTEKQKLIAALNKQMVAAKKVQQNNKPVVKKLMKEAFDLSQAKFKKEYKSVVNSNANKALKVRKDSNKELLKAKDTHLANMKRIQSSSFKDPKEKKLELANEKNSYAATKKELITARNNEIAQLNQENYGSFLGWYRYNQAVRNNSHSFGELIIGRLHHFKANFDFTQWITKYALYIIIVLLFAVLAIVSKTAYDVNILNGKGVLTCLQQISPKIFYSLGAACLILLGGTDLSIGRLTGIGVSFTLMALSSNQYQDNFGHVWFNMANVGAGGRVMVALLVSIGFCTLFSSISGFFSAKFKIHPFITTLAIQLISYGLFQIFFSAQSSFMGSPNDSYIMQGIRGSQSWLLILYAVIAIALVWFIWNKTRFGKNLYAVGGNQEAAKVSGINPLVITLLAFVMAGVLYGLGGFVQAAQVGTGNFNTGYGSEIDAIAACVIGGISFTGGVGKVSGAVIGTVVLGFLTYAFSAMGLDTNLQLVIKGLIILAAVTLDCVKYLKKK